MTDLATLSVWDALQCESGVNVGELAQIVACDERWDVEHGWSCTAEIGRLDVAAAALVKRNVLRFELGDGTVREYRIAEVDDAHSTNPDTLLVQGQDPRLDLAERVLLSTTGSGGVVYFDDGRAELAPDDYIDDVILPACVAAGIGVSKGTITPTVLMSLDWSKSSALALLQQLVAAIRERGIACEFDYRRNGSTDYKIDLVTAIGSSANAPELHVGRHVTSWRTRKTTTDQASRVVPFGAVDASGYAATIARGGWEVTAKSTNVLTLEDPLGGAGPVQFTSQHNDPNGAWYLEATDGTPILVTASSRTSATQSSVTVASGTLFTVGDIVEFRAAAAGTLLTSLTHPTYIQAPPTGYGEKIVPLDRPALRGERNLFANPWCSTWPVSTNPPTGWAIGTTNGIAQAMSRETTALGNVHFGTYGIRLAYVGGQGGFYIDTPTANIHPVLGAAMFSFSVSMTTWHATRDLLFTLTTTPAIPYTSSQWIVPLASIPLGVRWDVTIAGIQLPVGTTDFTMRLYSADQYDWLFDAIQLTQTPLGADEFFTYSRANALWQSGNEYLTDFGDPPAEFEGNILDYYRLDPTAWAALSVVPGVSTRVVDDDRALDTTVRAIGIEWNRMVAGDTRIRWSTRPPTLVASGSASTRQALRAIQQGPTAVPPGTPGNGGGTGPSPIPVPVFEPGTLVYPFIAGGSAGVTLTNFPAAETERTTLNEGWLWLYPYPWARVEARVATAASQGQFVVKYKTATAGAWDYLDGVSGPLLTITSTGTLKGDDVAIAPGALGDVIVGLFESGGNGTDDPVVGHVLLHCHAGAQIVTPSGCTILSVWPQQDDWSRYTTVNDLYNFAFGVSVPNNPLQYGEGTWYHGSTPSSTESFDAAETWYGHKTIKAYYGSGGFDFMPSDGGVPGHNEVKDWPTDLWLRMRVKFPTGFVTPSGRHTFFEVRHSDYISFGFTKDGGTDKVAAWLNYATGTEQVVGTATTDVIGQDWIEVALHRVESGANYTVDFYLGTPCTSLTVFATVTGALGTPGNFDTIAVNNNEHTDPGASQFFYLGDWEMVPEATLANPFGYS